MFVNCCGVEVLYLQKEINLIVRVDLMFYISVLEMKDVYN